ncbi:hypothetical protein AMJ86_01635 [bacterium SM23_57]|nr:MAG: hypothetical protein AMJ86_01635 [bacterium SM23_57]
MDHWAKSPRHRLLLLLFVAALVIRIIYCCINPNPYQGLIKGEIISDATEYDMIARTLAAGGGFGYYPDQPTAFRNPLLPFLMAGVYVVTGPNPVAVQVLMIILGSLIPPVLFLLARQIVEPAAAFLAAIAAVFYPSLVIFSVSTMSETPFILLILLSLLYWYRFSITTHGEWMSIILAGVFTGLALLTRSVFGPLLVLWFFYMIFASGRDRWQHILRFAAFCVLTIMVLLPWAIRNHVVFGETFWITTNGGFNLWHRHNLLPPDGTLYSRQDIQQELQRIYRFTRERIGAGEDPVEVTRPFLAQTVRGYLMRLGLEEKEYVDSFQGLNEFQVDRRLFKEAVTAIQRYPLRAVIKMAKNTIKFWDPYHDPNLINRDRRYNLAYGIMAPFLLWGIALSFLQWRRHILLYFAIIAFWCVSVVFILMERFRLPVETIGLIFVSVAMIILFRRAKKPWLPWVVIVSVIVINLIIMQFGGPVLQCVRETIHGIR